MKTSHQTTISQATFIAWRFYLLLACIFLIALILVVRIFDLAILSRHFLLHKGNERELRLVKTPAFRGMIVDRNGFPLAVSTAVFSAWVDPQTFSPSAKSLQSLCRLLGLDKKVLLNHLKSTRKKQREFVYLKRSFSPDLAAQIKALNLPQVYLQKEYRRFYPEGDTTAHVIGLTNVDDQGQEGLELAYNDWLVGEPGKEWVIKDRMGRIISVVQTLSEQKPGRDLVLSIDRRIQYLAAKELAQGVKQNNAASGSVVVLDVKTGEILAMVNEPSFNPNARPLHQSDALRNRAVTDIFEPGSTMKAFSVAAALDSGAVEPGTQINTSPGWIKIGNNTVKDEKDNGLLSIAQILQLSSNVGVTKLIQSIAPDHLWNLLHRIGFGEITGVGFPGEQSGVLEKHHPWGAFTLATLAFGYGTSVTVMQLARAYAVIAHEGIKMPVSLLRLDHPPEGERIINAKISQQMLHLLESVVESKQGMGKYASVPGFRVAGKTGTAIIASKGVYQKHHYISSFVGIAPVSDPRLVIVVVINEPHGKNYYGGLVAGPMFKKIMESSLRLMNIPPDKDFM